MENWEVEVEWYHCFKCLEYVRMFLLSYGLCLQSIHSININCIPFTCKQCSRLGNRSVNKVGKIHFQEVHIWGQGNIRAKISYSGYPYHILESNMGKKVSECSCSLMPHHSKVHCFCYFSGNLNSWVSQKHGQVTGFVPKISFNIKMLICLNNMIGLKTVIKETYIQHKLVLICITNLLLFTKFTLSNLSSVPIFEFNNVPSTFPCLFMIVQTTLATPSSS